MLNIPHHEFWPGRLYEAPAYAWLTIQCLRRGVGFTGLFKANYGIDHGGAAFASKYEIQDYLGQSHFPETILLHKESPLQTKVHAVQALAEKVGYPLILKPDYGFTGRGVFKVENAEQITALLPKITIDYLAQAFIPAKEEFGVFYVRHDGVGKIIGINRKHLPTVTGDGIRPLRELIESHPRYNHFWHSYLNYHDLEEILPAGLSKKISFIGSHTMGSKFTEDTNLATPALLQAVEKIMGPADGFNYCRLDVLTKSVASFQAGEFLGVVEANGIDALPTNVFDPDISVWKSYRIYFHHMNYLAKISYEQRRQPMHVLPYRAFVKKATTTQQEVIDQQFALEA